MKKKILASIFLVSSHLAHGMSKDDFILFDYTADQNELRNQYSSDKDAFKNLVDEKSTQRDLVAAFHVWAYNELQDYCKKSKKTDCHDHLTKTGTVVLNKFLPAFKTSFGFPNDLIHMVNETIFDELGSLQNINFYLNALEQRYVKEQSPLTVFEQLIGRLEINNLMISDLLNDEDNFITILLRYIANNIPFDSAAMGDVFNLLSDKKLAPLITYIFEYKIKKIDEIKDTDAKQNAIEDFIDQVTKVDAKTPLFTAITDYLNNKSLEVWVREIKEKQATMDKVEPEKKEKELEVEDIIKNRKGKKGSSKKKKGPIKKFEIGENTIIKKEDRESEKEVVLTPTTPLKEEDVRKQQEEDVRKQQEEDVRKQQEEDKRKQQEEDERKQQINDEKNRFIDLHLVELESYEVNALIDQIDQIDQGDCSEEKKNMIRLLYNLYQEKQKTNERVEYCNTDQKSLIDLLKKTHNIDVPALVDQAEKQLQNPQEMNLYLNALIKDFKDNQLNNTPLDDPRKTIAHVAQKNNFILLAQSMQPSNTPANQPSNVIKITTNPVDAQKATKQLAEAFLDISH